MATTNPKKGASGNPRGMRGGAEQNRTARPLPPPTRDHTTAPKGQSRPKEEYYHRPGAQGGRKK